LSAIATKVTKIWMILTVTTECHHLTGVLPLLTWRGSYWALQNGDHDVPSGSHARPVDPENEELKDGRRRALDQLYNTPLGYMMKLFSEWAMADPELRAIFFDPDGQQLLLDSSASPAAAAAHVKNPNVAAKVQKLMDAGVMQI